MKAAVHSTAEALRVCRAAMGGARVMFKVLGIPLGPRKGLSHAHKAELGSSISMVSHKDPGLSKFELSCVSCLLLYTGCSPEMALR